MMGHVARYRICRCGLHVNYVWGVYVDGQRIPVVACSQKCAELIMLTLTGV